jgi:basic amino acid/polyamine antiporter, APA family
VAAHAAGLARKLGAFDATLIVIGGIIGTGIFMTPSIVAQRAQTPALIIGVWVLGGVIALIGAFIFAELAWRKPSVGGTYGYLRDAYHPVLAFMSGWTSLFVTNSGSYAASAVTFAVYASPFFHLAATPIAITVIVAMSTINCFGVQEGVWAQNLLTMLKIGTIIALVVAAFFGPREFAHAHAIVAPAGLALIGILGAALLPVFYTYDGWQTAPFMDEELKDPARTLAFGLIWGVIAIVVLYLAVTLAEITMLGPAGLAATATPATEVLRRAVGPVAAALMAGCIALSSLGLISNTSLVIPRLYFAMAQDGLFFKQLAYVHPRTQAPVVAIILQAVVSIVIVESGRYDQILNYVASMDFLYMVLFAGAVFVFRRRGVAAGQYGVRVPLHPWSTLFFASVCAAVVINSFVAFPRETLVGLAILLSGAPVYLLWRRRQSVQPAESTLS